MRGTAIHRPTQKRIEWLELLEREGSAVRPTRSRVGYDCMSLGWTRWLDAQDPRAARYREEITDEGRQVLADWHAV